MRTRSTAAVLCFGVTASLALSGCGAGEGGADAPLGEPGTPTASDVSLTQSSGCGDAFFWAANRDGTVAITVAVDARDRSRTEPTLLDFVVPDERVRIEVQYGRSLVQPFCNDVVDQDWAVDRRVAVVAGAGRITLAPPLADPMTCGASGALHLEGIVADDGTRFDPVVDVETAGIGCYAG